MRRRQPADEAGLSAGAAGRHTAVPRHPRRPGAGPRGRGRPPPGAAAPRSPRRAVAAPDSPACRSGTGCGLHDGLRRREHRGRRRGRDDRPRPGPDRVVVAGGYLVEPTSSRCSTRAGRWPPTARSARSAPAGAGCCSVTASARWSSSPRRRPAARRRAARPAAPAGAGPGDAYTPCQPRPEGPVSRGRSRPPCSRAGIAAGRRRLRQRARFRHRPERLGRDRRCCARSARARDRPGQLDEIAARPGPGGLRAARTVVTMHALRSGRLPVNAGFLGPDEELRRWTSSRPDTAVTPPGTRSP